MKNLNIIPEDHGQKSFASEMPRKKGWRREKLNENEMPLLFLIPLVETAWAHGAVARNEKQIIFAAAREEKIDEKDELNEVLDEMLIYQPGRQFFTECLETIKSELAAMTVKKREIERKKLIERCKLVAAAAGTNSPMDVEKFTSDEEREVLMRLITELEMKENKMPNSLSKRVGVL
ncbi:MAG: hypothetical protein LUM44_04695 [Pyrinomonadaceae bacterium]|nr:hypothetical protein [Pyrinomonadaceae bacterium]